MPADARFAFVLLALVGAAASCTATVQAAPNVVIFYADDLGWAELGCQGNPEIPTPHIDSIAANGLRCTQGYVAATYCSPSRAGLMTGRYPTRFGHETNQDPDSSGLIGETTLASRLKASGYATACIGKWHLGAAPERLPMARGFDEFYGTVANTPFFHPKRFIDSRKSADVAPVEDNAFYTTDAYADRAVEWLGDHASGPWFLYLPFNAQHAPLEAPRKYLDRFPHIADSKRRTFAAMLAAMDDAVGRVLATVRKLGQEENTLVFFIADNGGPTNSTTSSNGPLRGQKATTFEGGPRVPFLVQWKGRIPAGKTYDPPVMNLDVVPTVMAAAGKPVGAADKIDGVDLVPFFTGASSGRPHETMFWRFVGQWAVRSGDWKLVVAHGGSGRPELYDLSADIGERKDLAAAHPERVAELQRLYDAWNAEQAPRRDRNDEPKPKRKRMAADAACEQADFLDPKAPSLPRVFKAAGYTTAHFGKWHLGGGRDVDDAPGFAAYGYDEHAGTWESPEPDRAITAEDKIWSAADPVKRWERTAYYVDRTLAFLSRRGDHPCFVNVWLDDPHTPWVPDAVAGKGGSDRENLRRVLEELDRQIGRLRDGLRQLGIERRTLVVFTSDNGPLPTLGGDRSGSLRGSKLSLYEGGIRLPFVAVWPGVIPAGRVDETTVLAAVDLFPTLCAVAGVTLPPGVELDGEDRSESLRGTPLAGRSRPLFWEYGRNENSFAYPAPGNGGRTGDRSPNVAMRDGYWKLLVNADGTGTELYDLSTDPSERHDLSGNHADETERLREMALRWRRSLP